MNPVAPAPHTEGRTASIARTERAGATGVKLLRADSGFWSNKLIARLERAGWQYSISVRLQPSVTDAIAAIGETDWQPLADYPDDGEAQIAETTLGSRRLIVRRTRRSERRPSCGPTGATSPS